jgi:hypothetical protein
MNALAQAGFRITGNLNEGIGDAAPGSPAAGQAGLPVVEGALGQLGVNVFMSASDLVNYCNTAKTNNVLGSGWYKYVQFKSTWSATLALGQALWYATVADMLNNIVTADAAATSIFAGLALCSTTTKGNYWWIQESGVCWCIGQATITDKTAGNILVVTDGTHSTFDGIADGTDYDTTALKLKLYKGVWLDAPADATLKRALVYPLAMFQ